jgi:RimJ/RimL family protein N-acetyltransferase
VLVKTINQLPRRWFAAEPAALVFDAMAVGNTPSVAFVDDPETPSVALIWDTGRRYFIAGEADHDGPYREAAAFLKAQLVQSLSENGHLAVKIAYSSDTWRAVLTEGLAEFAPALRDRVVYRHDLQRVPDVTNARLDGVVRAIGLDVLESPSLENVALVSEEVASMWGDTRRFLAAGFGYCAIIGRAIVGWCTAEDVSLRSCGIGIETISAYQNLGIATTVGAAFVEACARARIVPYWDSWASNLPSIHVAEKLGFRKVQEYQVLFIR